MSAVLMTVCTGNICRSAFAQAWLQDRLGSQWSVVSAGTGAYHQLPVPRPVLRLAESEGLDLSGHQARPLTDTVMRREDPAMVLTATSEHRREVLSIWPKGLRRTFTFLEAAELCQRLVNEPEWSSLSVPDRVRRLADRRGRLEPGVDRDIADPYGLADAAYVAMADQLKPALAVVADALTA